MACVFNVQNVIMTLPDAIPKYLCTASAPRAYALPYPCLHCTALPAHAHCHCPSLPSPRHASMQASRCASIMSLLVPFSPACPPPATTACRHRRRRRNSTSPENAYFGNQQQQALRRQPKTNNAACKSHYRCPFYGNKKTTRIVSRKTS